MRHAAHGDDVSYKDHAPNSVHCDAHNGIAHIRIEAHVQRAVGIEPRHAVKWYSSKGAEVATNYNLPVGLHHSGTNIPVRSAHTEIESRFHVPRRSAD